MDSVDSPFQLIVPKDVQVTITSSVGDPLRIKFDNSKSYEVRSSLVGNIDLNRLRRGGALFCFDYMGDDLLKADMLTYKINPASEKHSQIDLALQIVTGPEIKNLNEDCKSRTASSNQLEPPVFSSQLKSSRATNREEMMLHQTSASQGQLTSESEHGWTTIRQEQKYRGTGNETAKFEQKDIYIEGQTTQSLNQEAKKNDRKLEWGYDQPNKPHEVVKIGKILQSNFLSEKRKAQHIRLSGENGCLKAKEDQVQHNSKHSDGVKGKKQSGKPTIENPEINNKNKVKQKFVNGSAEKLTQNLNRVDFSDRLPTDQPVCHLSRRVNINLGGKDSTEPQNFLESRKMSHQKLLTEPPSIKQEHQDDATMKDLQKNMQKKYVDNIFDSKKSSFYADKGSTMGNESRGQLTTDRFPPSKDNATERKVMHSDRVNPSDSKKREEDSPDRTYLLKNLKLLEKEISLLQAKTAINHQEEEYLCKVYDRLSDVQNRLSLLEPSIEYQDAQVDRNHHSDRPDSKLFGISEAYEPQFLAHDDSEPRKHSPMPKENSGILMPSLQYYDSKDDQAESSQQQYNFFSKKNSKTSKFSAASTIHAKATSFKSNKSSVVTGSDFYDKQMNKSRVKEARLDAKRLARSEVEMKNCTFAPKLKKKKLVTEA